MNENISVFALCFFLAGFSGLASLLRSCRDLTTVKILSSFLNSGLLGLGICLLWFMKYREDVYSLVGICVLVGLGGQSMISFVLAVIERQARLMYGHEDEEKPKTKRTPKSTEKTDEPR